MIQFFVVQLFEREKKGGASRLGLHLEVRYPQIIRFAVQQNKDSISPLVAYAPICLML